MRFTIKRLRKNKKLKVILFGSLLVISMVVIGVLLWGNQSDSQTPGWDGVYPGITTKAELVALYGKPDKKEFSLVSWSVTYVYEFEFKYMNMDKEFSTTYRNKFVLQNGIVKVIKRNTNFGASGFDEIPTDKEIFEQFGVPEEVTWSRLSPSMWALLYCNQGVIAFGVPDEISEIYYFEPMSQSKCIRKFPVVSTTNPYRGTDVIMQKDPWGFRYLDADDCIYCTLTAP